MYTDKEESTVHDKREEQLHGQSALM